MQHIAFIGDAHIGYRHRFKSQRLQDYVSAFNEALEKALSRNPLAIVFLGDLLHHCRPDPVSLRTVLKKLIWCSGKTNVIVCVGNHEIEGHLGTTYSPIYSDVSDKITVLTTENPHKIIRHEGKTIGFHGFEYIRSDKRATEKLREISSNPGSDINILCLHQAIEKYLSPHEITLSALRQVAGAYDLIVSGHVHKHQMIAEVQDITPAYYVGSTERISFNEAANPTGFMVFTLGDLSNPEYVPVNSAPMALIREKFSGTPWQVNERIKKIITERQERLLRIDLEVDLEGDPLDINRDWGEIFPEKTILEVNVSGSEPERQAIEALELNEDLISSYFQSSHMQDEELEKACIELFQRYGR
jgi:DNA repair exonuclease SbcCD nuclease subunit